MRARNRQSGQNLRAGRTIAAEREHAETDSERMQARRQARKTKNTQVALGAIFVGIVAILIVIGVASASREQQLIEQDLSEYQLRALLVDEDNREQVSSRVKNYAILLEQALIAQGISVTKFTLPTGTSRQLYVDIEGRDEFYKVTFDRGAGVTAEDIRRMRDYLVENELQPSYVDVRIEGKAYFK